MTALLEVREVSLSFGGVQALRSVSLDVHAESIVGLIGPNGAGKTTLFNVVSGLLRADGGSIRIDGDEVAHLPAHLRAARGVARSFQNLGLMDAQTVETNVLALLHRTAPYRPVDVFLRPWRRSVGEKELAGRCREVLTDFGLEGEAARRVGDLSFAKARFVELAAVVAERPRLMLLDEPTTGLDIAETVQLAEVLEAARADGTTVVVVAHDVEFVMRVCDHIYVLAEGRLLFDGPPAAVRSDPVVIEAYLGRPS